MGKSKMTVCKSCGFEIGTKGTVTCPRCGSIRKTPFYKRTWFIVIAVIFIIGIIGSSQSHTDADKNVEDKTALIKTTENQEKKEKIKNKCDRSRNFWKCSRYNRIQYCCAHNRSKV